MYRTLTFLIFLTSFTCWSQLDPSKKYSVNTVAFYNVENLFDRSYGTSIQDDAIYPASYTRNVKVSVSRKF